MPIRIDWVMALPGEVCRRIGPGCECSRSLLIESQKWRGEASLVVREVLGSTMIPSGRPSDRTAPAPRRNPSEKRLPEKVAQPLAERHAASDNVPVDGTVIAPGGCGDDSTNLAAHA